MNVGEIYHRGNEYQASSAFSSIKKVKNLLNNKFGDRKCKLLDIGTGDGRALSEGFVKESGLIFEKVIGTDMDHDMINVAKKTYENDLISFEVLNIEEEEHNVEFLKRHNNFDIVLSYFCLHWIEDMEKTLKTINKFLKPNGVFHIIFLEKTPIGKVFIELANTPKFQKYRNDIYNYRYYTYCEYENIDEYFEKILNTAGFTVEFSESKCIEKFNFKSKKALEDLYGVLPFIRNMTNEERADFLSDAAERTREIGKQCGLLDFEVEFSTFHCVAVKNE